jgi:hypothetical protein
MVKIDRYIVKFKDDTLDCLLITLLGFYGMLSIIAPFIKNPWNSNEARQDNIRIQKPLNIRQR